MDAYVSNIPFNTFTSFALEDSNGLACNYSDSTTDPIYCGIFYTTNYGKTWNNSNRTAVSYSNVALSGTNGLASGRIDPYTYALLYSTDSGVTWTRSSDDNNVDSTTSLTLDGFNGVSVNEGNADKKGLYYTNNAGQTWSQTLIDLPCWRGSVDGLNGIAGSKFNGIYYTVDGGATWSQSNINFGSFDRVSLSGLNGIAASIGDTPYIGGGLYYTIDGGKTWSVSNQSTGDFVSIALSGRYAIASTYYLGGIYYSTDYGQTWSVSNINSGAFSSVDLDGTNGIACSFNAQGIFYTTNGGMNWVQTPGSLINPINPGQGMNFQTAYINGSHALAGGSYCGAWYVDVTVVLEPIINKQYGIDTSFTLDISSDSPAPFSYISSNTSVATVDSNGLVTINSPGITKITVSQNALTNYYSTLSTTTLYVSGGTIYNTVINAPSSLNNTYGDVPFNLNPTSENTSPFSYVSSDPSIASVNSSGLVSIFEAGSVTITISQPSIPNYYTEASTNVIINIAKQPSVISTSQPYFVKEYNSSSFSLTATSNNTSDLLYTSSNPLVATVDNNGFVSIVDKGTAVITISQNSTSRFTSAFVNIPVSIGVANIIIESSFDKLATEESFKLNPISNSDALFIYESDNPYIATVDDYGVVTLTGLIGSANITISQNSNVNYTSGSVETTINVEKEETIIIVNSSFNKLTTDEPFNVLPISNSDADFIYESDNPYIATIQSDGVVILTGLIGVANIIISQNSNAYYRSDSTQTTIYVQ